MKARELKVEGAFEFTPQVFRDDRGAFLSSFQSPVFHETVGHALFPVAQQSSSLSRRGVVRGLHYTATPPGMAKYVSCPRGRILDVLLDVRVGSPTFGCWDSVLLDQQDLRAVYFPIGVAHMFVVLEDDSVMSYMLSQGYVPHNERALSPLDAELGLPIPDDLEPILSERDRVAPTLAEAHAAGLLPHYDRCLEVQAQWSGDVTTRT